MNPSLLLIPDRYKASKLYSQIPDSGAGDLAFTRALDTATRVNSAGLIEKVRTNLISYSEQFNDAYWDKIDATVSANSTTAPNGTLTADTITADAGGSFPRVLVSYTIADNVIVTQSIYLKANTANSCRVISILKDGATGASAVFNLTNGAVSNLENVLLATATNVGNGWYRCAITFNVGSGGSAINYRAVSHNVSTIGGNEFTDGRSLFCWGSQLEVSDFGATPYIPTTTAAVSVGMLANIPRIDYTGGGCGKLLLEPQRTNTAQFSEQFDNAFWTKGNSTISANVSATLDPSGYNGADKLQEDNSTDSHFFGSDTASATSAEVVTFSIFLKAAERSFGAIRLYTGTGSIFGYYNLANGTLGTIGAGGTGSIVSYGNGWYRCSLTITMASSSVTLPYVFTSTGNGVNSYTGTTGHGIYCFGAQQEIASYPTSYINTLGASVTRSADAASKTGISSLISSTAGTVFIDAIMNTGNTQNADIFLLRGPGTGVFVMFMSQATGSINLYLGTSFAVPVIKSGNNRGLRLKIAISYQSGALIAYVNGVQTLSTTYTIEPDLADLYLNTNDIATSRENTILNTFALYTSVLSNAELQTLTTL